MANTILILLSGRIELFILNFRTSWACKYYYYVSVVIKPTSKFETIKT